ncbi:hypothetical protein CDV36_016240 [Fusarium kuroshium]|uniref:Uncharacterized protein n=1 Tax=Fusarium kuroshium TaxID=2010991 RepID=A0A3M2QVZ5_9HYPO|nr:hypothetical protein CDV36_016240 [Fusarium kuroshium]
MGVLSAQPRTLYSFSMFFRGSGFEARMLRRSDRCYDTSKSGHGNNPSWIRRLGGAFGFTVGRWSWMLAFIDNRGSLQFTMCLVDSLRGLELGRRGVRELSPKYETVELCS